MSTVLPTLGWFGVIFITVLLGIRVANDRMQISAGSRRRDNIPALLRQLNSCCRWTRRHVFELAGARQGSNLKQHQPSEPLGEGEPRVVVAAPLTSR